MLAFLRRHRLAAPGDIAGCEALAGGVSSDIWRVDLRGGPIAALVVKRALPRLRVAQVWEAPVERNRYERRWLEAANAIVPGAAPRVLAGDDEGFFAMEYLARACRSGRRNCAPDAPTLRSPRTSAASSPPSMTRPRGAPTSPPLSPPTQVSMPCAWNRICSRPDGCIPSLEQQLRGAF